MMLRAQKRYLKGGQIKMFLDNNPLCIKWSILFKKNFIYIVPTQSDAEIRYSDAEEMDCMVYSTNKFSFKILNV